MCNKMRIIYIIHSTIMGGATISFFNMIVPLMDKGVIPYIIVPYDEPIDKDFNRLVSEKYIKVYKCTLSQSVLIKSGILKYMIQLLKLPIFMYRKMKSFIEILILVKKIKPDIIHTNTGVIHEGFAVAKFYGIPHVWHLREYQNLDFNMQILSSFSAFCNKLRQSYVISITNDILNHFGLVGSPHATTIYNGIFSRNEVQPIDAKENYFLCASRLSPEKGFNDIIKAFSEFLKKYKKYKLCIAGFGEKKYVEKLKLLTEEYGCSDKVEFIGFIQDVKPMMRKAKALLVASNFEGFGRMTAEAAFCGCIVIGRNTGGTKEILDYTGGMQFTNNEDFINKMEMVAKMEKEEYEEFVVEAQQKAVERYSIESNVEGIHLLYKQILSNP